MATRKSAEIEEKALDLPPKGSRNADPITDAPGAHPIETGVGASVGGAAAGLAIGMLGGPVGAVIGGIVGGAVAGGLMGKGMGEIIDPTTEDAWFEEYANEHHRERPREARGPYRHAYRYGLLSAEHHRGRRFDELEADLRSGWNEVDDPSNLNWDEARHAAQHAFDRRSREKVSPPVVVADHQPDAATRRGTSLPSRT